jgi:DHA3 family multidrug efflux protein-like MFS transporter
MIGPLAQNVLIPYMAGDAGRSAWSWLLGSGTARGIALVFVLAGVVQVLVVAAAFGSRPYRLLSKSYVEAEPAVG